jgi:ketosteroid isomerase-like protein
MKNKTMALLSIGIVTVGLSTACTQPQNTNTNSSTQNVATPEPTPDKEAIVAEITRIEKDWPRILKEKDGAAVRRLEADDIILLSYEGSLGSKEQDIKDIEAGDLTFDSWDVSELSVKVMDNDAAVASFLMTIVNAKYKDGSNISGHYRAVDTFARRNGQWQIVASTIVKLSADAERSLTATASPTPPGSSTPAAKPSPATKPSPPRPKVPRKLPSPPPANQ